MNFTDSSLVLFWLFFLAVIQDFLDFCCTVIFNCIWSLRWVCLCCYSVATMNDCIKRFWKSAGMFMHVVKSLLHDIVVLLGSVDFHHLLQTALSSLYNSNNSNSSNSNSLLHHHYHRHRRRQISTVVATLSAASSYHVVYICFGRIYSRCQKKIVVCLWTVAVA